MGTFDNVMGELLSARQAAIDGQIFTYVFRIFVSNFCKHNTSAFQGNPLATPGLNNFRFRCEDDAHFRINTVTMSCYGPVEYNPNIAPDSAAQLYLLTKYGATVFPMPGKSQAIPTASSAITAVNAGSDTITLTTGYAPKVGHPIMFFKAGAAVMPGGLSDNVLYYIASVAGDDVTLMDENGDVVDITSAGSGTLYANLVPVVVASGAANAPMLFTSTAGYATNPKGQPVTLITYGTGVLPTSSLGAMVAGQTYYKVPYGINSYYLALTPQDALAGTVLLNTSGPDQGTATIYALEGSDRAERGLAVAISDLSKTSRVLTSDGQQLAYIPVENLFAPAYGTDVPGPLKTLEGYVLPKQHELLFQFKNRDTMGFKTGDPDVDHQRAADFGHMVTVAFTGEKFYD